MTESGEELFLSADTLKKSVAQGVVVLGIRRLVLQLLLTFTNIILARLLAPEIFGVFGILSFVILTFGLVANFGMGPSLIQRKSNIKAAQLQAVFTLLLVASLAFVGLVYLLAPYINSLYSGTLGETGVFWLRMYSFSVVLDHIATISMHLLQRNLDFKKFTYGEILTTVVSQVLTIYLVFQGWGLGGLVLGNLLGKVFAIIIFYFFHPWRVGLSFSSKNIAPFLPFGLNFQANNLLSSFGGAVVPVVVGTLSGPTAVGLVNWAGGIKSAGLAPFDTLQKLIFPSVARSQDSPRFLKILVEKMLKLSCLLSFPLLGLIGGLAPELIKIIYTDKWLGGLGTLYLSLIQGVFMLFAVLFVDILLALGKAQTVRNISLFWAVLQWVLTIPLVLLFGFNGVVIAGIIVWATFFIPYQQVRKIVAVDFWPNVAPYFMYSLTCALFVYSISRWVEVVSVWQLGFIGSLGGSIYILLLFIFERNTLRADFLKLKTLLFLTI